MQEPTNRELKIMLDNLGSIMNRIENTFNNATESHKKTYELLLHVKDTQEQDHTRILKHDESLYGEDGIIRWKDKIWGMIKIVGVISTAIIAILITLFSLWEQNLRADLVDNTAEKVITLLENDYNIEIK